MYSANLGFLWKELSLSARIERAAAAGFKHVEFHDELQETDLDAVADQLNQLAMSVVGLNESMKDTRGCAAMPGFEHKALNDFQDAAFCADRVNAQAIHVLAGDTKAPDAEHVFIENLSRFADMTDKTILIEPLCRKAAPDYWLNTLQQAANILFHVKRPNVKIMFDIFHVHQEGENEIDAWQRYGEHVGHVQIANPITRNEPNAQALDFVQHIMDQGWTQPIGAEYVPTGSVENGLTDWWPKLR